MLKGWNLGQSSWKVVVVSTCWNKQSHGLEIAETKLAALISCHRDSHATAMSVSRHCLLATRRRLFLIPSRALATHAPEIPKRPEPAYPGHIPLNWFESAFLAVGSGVVSLLNPRRGGARGSHSGLSLSFFIFSPLLLDMVAALGETTAGPSLPRWRDAMLTDAEGRQVLRDRPRVNTDTIDMTYLAALPENTFGFTYFRWLERCGVTPDSRDPVCIIFQPS